MFFLFSIVLIIDSFLKLKFNTDNFFLKILNYPVWREIFLWIVIFLLWIKEIKNLEKRN